MAKGSALELQTPPALALQVTIKGIVRLPDVDPLAEHSTVTLGMLNIAAPGPSISPHTSLSRLANGMGAWGTMDTLQVEAPPLAEVSLVLLPSLDRKTPISYRLALAALIVTSISKIKDCPPTHDRGLPAAAEMALMETSLAVQPISEPKRSAEHWLTGKAQAAAVRSRDVVSARDMDISVVFINIFPLWIDLLQLRNLIFSPENSSS